VDPRQKERNRPSNGVMVRMSACAQPDNNKTTTKTVATLMDITVVYAITTRFNIAKVD
jgi:hypothetical protein